MVRCTIKYIDGTEIRVRALLIYARPFARTRLADEVHRMYPMVTMWTSIYTKPYKDHWTLAERVP